MRLPSGDRYAPQVDKEQRWLPVLAPQLPLPIPMPLAKGEPGAGFPYPWSVYRWLDGELASSARDRRPARLRVRAGRLPRCAASRRRDRRAARPASTTSTAAARCAPTRRRPARRSTRSATRSRATRVRRVWDDALRTTWDREPVWVHGDVAAGNLLVRDGRLAAVIDFGSSGVGDPACDTVIAWTFLSGPSRAAVPGRARRRRRARGRAAAAGRCGRH